ncbi:MAG TPA: M3 family oligoendopeptidase [Acetobacteraceae bacterium]|nr:M3 family oligoendopeptidase [Acetobacteraceae bacterium]
MKFESIKPRKPSRGSLTAQYAEINALLDQKALSHAMQAWDNARRAYESWSALTYLHFAQDTTNADYKAEREYADALSPFAIEMNTNVKKRLLSECNHADVEKHVGAHAVRLWECDVTTFAPEIAADLEAESKLEARYTEILASAKIEFDGKTHNLAGLAPYTESLNRGVRHAAETARWAFFAEHAEELDDIYDRLVKLRHTMAIKLGYKNYTPLAYRKMRRVDYDAGDVAHYRTEVLEYVTPLVARLVDERRRANGWETIHYWDEKLIDPAGNPKPAGGHDYLVAQAQIMFDNMDKRLAHFYKSMNDGGFMDLKNRPTKAGGGFCTSFPTDGMPFIFANFNGTHGDINVFTHEMGHAFQNYESRHQPNIDYLWPTMESAEIHSMSLEFLTYPQMDLLVGPDAADRFRRMHLIGALEFLPYGVLVDHFQHDIYANPDMSQAERRATWRRLEQIYMPWRDYGDLSHPETGARFHAQGHIFGSPFYYIDYTLAQCCALQFWAKSQEDYKASLDAYVKLCALGGSAPFLSLVESAGLISPFAPGALLTAVNTANTVLMA